MTRTHGQPRRIAILKPCCIGDCIMALPAIDAIAAACSSATIEVFVGSHSRVAVGFRPALTTKPLPDAIDFPSALLLARRLRLGRYDIVVSLDRSRWLRLAAHLSRAGVTANARAMSPEFRHESEVYLDVVREIGVPTPDSTPAITPTEDARRKAAEILGSCSWPVAVLHPGGAQNPGVSMLDKRWPVERFVELALALQRDGLAVLLSGGAGDRAVAHLVADRAGISASAILAGDVDIETLAAILHRASVYVGPDTGVSHIAAAVGAPTIAIFGPTNPRRYRPLGRDVQVLAPPESWQIPDRDLRRTATSLASTASVSLEAVLSAARAAVSRANGMNPCSS